MASRRQRQLSSALTSFYQRPVAKVSVELFLSLSAIIFFALFAIRPTLVTMTELIKEIEDKKSLDEQLGEKAQALSTVQPEFFRLQDRLKVLDQTIPSEANLIETLLIIEKIASDNAEVVITDLGVEPASTTITAEIDLDAELEDESNNVKQEDIFTQLNRQSIPITVGVAGDYPAIKSFIDSIQNSQRAFAVRSITFVKQDTHGSAQLQATVKLTAPYFNAL